MGEIVPIKKFTKKKGLLSLLESQFSKNTGLGVEFVDRCGSQNDFSEIYRVYDITNGRCDRAHFIIERERKNGRIKEYALKGTIYFY